MQVSFTAETVRFTKLAEHVDAASLSEDASRNVALRSVPVITREKQVLVISRDGNFELTIDKLEPEHNPAREAFRQETSMQPWEIHKVVITNSSVKGYDGNGSVIIHSDNPQHLYVTRLAERINSDPYFASHVNIANALFNVSAKATNYTDPELRKFFAVNDTRYERENQFLIVKQNAVSLMKHWGSVLSPSSQTFRKRNSSSSAREYPEDASYTPEETMNMNMMQENIDGILGQRNPHDIEVITAIDTVNNKIDAEVIMTSDGQVLSMTSYVSSSDEQATIEVAYTESFETDPILDVDLLNVESTTFSEVEIINNIEP